MTRNVPFGNILVMRANSNIIDELDRYAAATGLAASTVCRKATGNPRLRDRLESRLARTNDDVAALRRFMSENPPVKSGSGSLACVNQIGNAQAACQVVEKDSSGAAS